MLPQNRDLVCSYLIDGETSPINHLPLEIFYHILRIADTRTNLEQFVDKNIDQPWNWGKYGLSSNSSITPKFIEKHIDKHWDFGEYGLSANSSITLKFIEDHIDEKWGWGTEGLSSNPIVTMEFVEKYIRRAWEWGNYNRGLIQNPLMDLDFIKLNLEIKFEESMSNADILSMCSSSHPLLPKYLSYFDWPESLNCDWQNQSCSEMDIFEYVEKHIDESWDFSDLSFNPVIPHKFIIKHQNKLSWGDMGLSQSPSVTPDFVEKFPDQNWWWGTRGLSSNPSITMKFIEDHINEKWCWDEHGLSDNQAVTPKFIREHRSKPWKFTFYSLSSHRMLQPIGPVISSMIIHK